MFECEKIYNIFDIDSDCETHLKEMEKQNVSMQVIAIIVEGNSLYILSFILSLSIHA